MGHPDHTLPEEFEMETLEKVPMEDKILLSREEGNLTPGELSEIISEQMRELPDALVEESGPEIFEVCFLVAEEIMHRMRGGF